MLVCLIGLTAMAGNRHNVTVVSANNTLNMTVFVNGSQKNKTVASKVNVNKLRGNKDYKVRVVFDNIKIKNPSSEFTLTNVTEDMELVAWIEGQQAYVMPRGDYDKIQQEKKAKNHAAGNKGGCGHKCGHSCGSAHSHQNCSQAPKTDHINCKHDLKANADDQKKGNK